MQAAPSPSPPVLEVYYASTCTPCRLDLPVLADVARTQDATVVIVMLTDPAQARAEFAAVDPGLGALAIPSVETDQRAVLRAAGDADGILPYALVKTPEGETCASWRGRLTLERVRKLIARCAPR